MHSEVCFFSHSVPSGCSLFGVQSHQQQQQQHMRSPRVRQHGAEVYVYARLLLLLLMPPTAPPPSALRTQPPQPTPKYTRTSPSNEHSTEYRANLSTERHSTACHSVPNSTHMVCPCNWCVLNQAHTTKQRAGHAMLPHQPTAVLPASCGRACRHTAAHQSYGISCNCCCWQACLYCC